MMSLTKEQKEAVKGHHVSLFDLETSISEAEKNLVDWLTERRDRWFQTGTTVLMPDHEAVDTDYVLMYDDIPDEIIQQVLDQYESESRAPCGEYSIDFWVIKNYDLRLDFIIVDSEERLEEWKFATNFIKMRVKNKHEDFPRRDFTSKNFRVGYFEACMELVRCGVIEDLAGYNR